MGRLFGGRRETQDANEMLRQDDETEMSSRSSGIEVVRQGAVEGATSIAGIEMFRKRAGEATVGELAGILLRDAVDVRRGDIIRPAASA